MTDSLSTFFSEQTLIPVVVLQDAADAVPLAEALLEGGVTSIEITLRTAAALKAIEQVAAKVPDILTGSGTITKAEEMKAAADAGAKFHVSPGITPTLAAYAQSHDMAWLPGVTNASNIMQALEYGFNRVKFFPASLSGGVPMLKQFASVFPALRICPTGGIDEKNLHEYASLPAIFAIGGSWLTPKEAIAAKDWKRVTAISRQSMHALKALSEKAA